MAALYKGFLASSAVAAVGFYFVTDWVVGWSTEFTIGDIVRSGFVRSYLINKIKLGIGMD